MQTLGQRLRDERQKKGLTIPELASRTRIRAQLFEAIEADRPELLPGRFFYRAFLRQYADLLELPQSMVQPEIERSLVDERAESVEHSSNADRFKPDVPPLPIGRVNLREEARRWLLRLTGLLGVLVLCSAAYFFWERWGQRWLDELWHTVATQPVQPASKPAPAAPPTTPAASAPLTSETPAEPTRDPLNSAAPTVPEPTRQPDARLDSTPPGLSSGRKIEIRAAGLCWVGGWRDGKQFVASVIHPGEVLNVDGNGLVRLKFGNSGNVAITVDGNPIPPIGAKGEPRILEYHNGAYRLLDRGSDIDSKP